MGGLPGAPEVLELTRDRDDVELVGGATRDLLLGARPRELDLVVGGGAGELAGELAARLNLPQPAVHERFGTALVRWEGGRVDVAERRREEYPAPGALPVVHPGSPEEDLLRRDFTVNAIAVALGEGQR